MPNISAHMIIANEVAKRLNIKNDDFIRGNLLPDISEEEDSHHKIQQGVYLIPDIEYFIKTLDLSKDFNIGYLTHLLLDKHYLMDYLGQLYPNTNIFIDGKIYQDYDYLNAQLVDKYNLDVDSIENELKKYDCKISEEKLQYNIEYLKQKKSGNPKYLNFESFAKFLSEISVTISKELIDYANKYSELSIRIRK